MCIDDTDGAVVREQCEDGSQALDPLFRRPVDADGNPTGPWERVDDGGCVEDPEPPLTFTVEDFRRLPLEASPLRVQPADGRGLVNVELVAWTQGGAQVLTTTLIGVPITVRATPVSWTWDFGDGSAPVTTDDPGAPWPDHSLGHPYARAGSYDVTVTTTWRGEFQLEGSGVWEPVVGTAETTSDAFTAQVFEARSALVADARDD